MSNPERDVASHLVLVPQKIRGKEAPGSVLRAARRAKQRACGFIKASLDAIVCFSVLSPGKLRSFGRKIEQRRAASRPVAQRGRSGAARPCRARLRRQRDPLSRLFRSQRRFGAGRSTEPGRGRAERPFIRRRALPSVQASARLRLRRPAFHSRAGAAPGSGGQTRIPSEHARARRALAPALRTRAASRLIPPVFNPTS